MLFGTGHFLDLRGCKDNFLFCTNFFWSEEVKINCKNNQHYQLDKGYQNLNSIQTCERASFFKFQLLVLLKASLSSFYL
jgi:hypothetical protein